MKDVKTLLLMLSGESTIPYSLLLEDEDFMAEVLANKPYDELLEYLNENY